MLKQPNARFAQDLLYYTRQNLPQEQTGLRGMSGNKGAVSIRLDYYDTSFCFITAHFAAGHENIDERNADYRTIVDGLHFLRGKTIDNHEYVSHA
jgi:hypothetical protein